MAEKDSDGLADSVSQLSARFDRLESMVTECLTREKSAVGQCAASAVEDHDNAGRRRVVDLDEQRRPTQSAVISSYSELQSEFHAIKESVSKINPRTAGGLSHLRTAGGGTYVPPPPPANSKTTQRIDKRKKALDRS